MKLASRRTAGVVGVVAVVALAVLLPGVLSGSAKKAVPAKSSITRYTAAGLETDSPSDLESYWAARVTYPTGNFNEHWLADAARQARRIPSEIPAGAQRGPAVDSARHAKSSLALSGSAFTFLGPQPQESTPATCDPLCFNFGRVSGRVNSIALDPATTTPGSMTAYFGADGGGVWKSTNCCTAATTWTVMTD